MAVSRLRSLSYLASVALLAGSSLLLAVGQAHAWTYRGNKDVCGTIGNAGVDAAQMSAAGVPWDQYGPWLKGQLSKMLADPDSLVRDVDDAKFIYEWFQKIYATPTMETVEAMYNECLKQPASKSSSLKRKIVL